MQIRKLFFLRKYATMPKHGWVAEWSKATVLKTVVLARGP